MENEKKVIKQELALEWIKADSGNTYLCPVKAIEKLDNYTEEDLKKICVDESMNPNNA